MKKTKKPQYIRFQDRIRKVISFAARSYVQIQEAYERLRKRYKLLTIGKLTREGCLYTGSFIVG